jgi:hypothetical protein
VSENIGSSLTKRVSEASALKDQSVPANRNWKFSSEPWKGRGSRFGLPPSPTGPYEMSTFSKRPEKAPFFNGLAIDDVLSVTNVPVNCVLIV